jgi:glycosyltransferase involved in cell wall biosynthesis
MPNYPQMEIYEGYKNTFYRKEIIDGIEIHRAWIFTNKSKSIFPRLLNYFSFVKTSFWVGLFKIGKFDYIFCESPPLFLGISAYLLKKIKGAKLIFNVSDLWPESAEKLGLVTNKLMLGASKRLEEFMYKRSELITGQTKGICANISLRFPDKKMYWFPNGADLSFYNSEIISSQSSKDWRKKNNFIETDFILFYGGIIGYAQGLEVILKAAELLKDKSDIKFILLGSGPEKERLIQLRSELDLKNVSFIEVVSKEKMPVILNEIDAVIIPLKRLELFKGAIPSKIFEALAMKKPLLLGVEGEAKELFIDQGKCGLNFIPEDEKDLSEKIMTLYQNKQLTKEFGDNGLKYVQETFDREKIIDDFWRALNDSKI